MNKEEKETLSEFKGSKTKESTAFPILPVIEITGKPYRKTTNRERDGENCGCDKCFGLCDWKFKVEIKPNLLIIPDFSNNTATIYTLENFQHAETDFGVDQPLNLPEEALTNTGINYLSIIPSVYQYEIKNETLQFNNKQYQTFGKVVVNISTN